MDCPMLSDSKKQVPTPLRCGDCWGHMAFWGSEATTSEVFLSTVVERHFFMCLNCGRVDHKVVLWPREFKRVEMP